jgi:tRNA/tmRNA/rRNA uracil-C5-methylase (TrmA/RlmC/RlmD family)
MRPDDTIDLQIEKPAAGGRMLARHNGQVVLVWGAIPGERVRARVERVGKGVLYADTVEVIEASEDRRDAGSDWRCGGNVLAHVAYSRQPRLKAEIIKDAFARIARMPMTDAPDVIASPEHGYRMRARLHASGERLGFFREGTHALCDPVPTGQLLPATAAWLAGVATTIREQRLAGLASLEVAENIAGDQRACHVELHAGVDDVPFAALASGLTGLSAQRVDRPATTVLAGAPFVSDVLHAREGDASSAVHFRREVRAFFQGNRFLLERLLRYVVSLVAAGDVIDLYAGVGLFGLSLAAAGADEVTLVEGDPVSGADLQENAQPFGARARVERRGVEAFLASAAARHNASPAKLAEATFIVDPPRTGMSREAVNGVIAIAPRRLVYVSCDVATLARDARLLVDAGYELGSLRGFDLFPNTAHVEAVAVFERA